MFPQWIPGQEYRVCSPAKIIVFPSKQANRSPRSSCSPGLADGGLSRYRADRVELLRVELHQKKGTQQERGFRNVTTYLFLRTTVSHLWPIATPRRRAHQKRCGYQVQTKMFLPCVPASHKSRQHGSLFKVCVGPSGIRDSTHAPKKAKPTEPCHNPVTGQCGARFASFH